MSIGITLYVQDKERAKAFYQKAFNLSPLYEDENGVTLRLEDTYVFLATTMADDRELIAPVALGSPDRGPRQVFSVRVPDVDAACRELRAKGISLLNGPENRTWGMRTASIQDPDGNVWAITTDLDAPGETP